MTKKAATMTSPCIGVCKIDEASRLCLGCARTIQEIGAWGGASEDFRQRVWKELPARRQRLKESAHK